MPEQLATQSNVSTLNPLLLQGVLEGLTDGILILSEQGEWVYHNYYAYCLCQRLNQDGDDTRTVPEVIWRNCEALLESRTLFPDQPIVIESEIALNSLDVYRIRVRWLTLEDSSRPYLAVLIEDRRQSMQSRAIAEAILYDLTPRQADVWLLRRAGFSYQQIAMELYITLNTVKRHLKDIYLKQKLAIEEVTDSHPMSHLSLLKAESL
jgi:DNA-binding CsgD family transcriptional regulator